MFYLDYVIGCLSNFNVRLSQVIFNFIVSFWHLGVTHNIPLLRDILTERRFVEGDINTKYLPEVRISSL
jgi:pyruvate carboxylase